MPCYDERNNPQYVAATARKDFEAEIKKLKLHNDHLTRVACEFGRWIQTEIKELDRDLTIENSGEFTKEAVKWWKEHQAFDNKRKSK